MNLPADPGDILEAEAEAGEALLMSGAEVTQVEDTMLRIARAFGVERVEAAVLPTAIFCPVRAARWSGGFANGRLTSRWSPRSTSCRAMWHPNRRTSRPFAPVSAGCACFATIRGRQRSPSPQVRGDFSPC